MAFHPVSKRLIDEALDLARRNSRLFGGSMSSKLRASIHRILFATGALAASVTTTVAQEAQTTDEIAEIVIVTGSYIRGTAEDAALPVDVISLEELEKQGAPSPVEMLKSVTVMNGIVGETNRHMPGRGQAQTGGTFVNLRGFGQGRTLVLLNGKRLASDDVNLMPANAIARIEILKEGGASTYGSDAIGGVVNYITKERVDGLELTADYRHIEDSDGDYNAGFSWGTTWGGGDFFFAANYFHRSQLRTIDRDWAVRPYLENPEGGWSPASNPGNFRFLTATGTGLAFDPVNRPDPGCQFFGGTFDPVTNQCVGQFSVWENIVDEQDTYQAFASANFDLSDTFSLKLEAVYGKTKVPNASASPSYAPIRRITETVYGSTVDLSVFDDPRRARFFYVPMTNPGFQGAFAPGGGYVPATALGTFIQIFAWRPFLTTGSPNAADGTPRYAFDREAGRVSAELTGQLGSVNLTTSLSYSTSEVQRHEVDILTGRLQLALRGFGGPNCDWPSPTAQPGQNGCLWYNPFSNAFPTTRTGVANPNYVAGAANSLEVIRWMEVPMTDKDTVDLAEFNTVLSGELPISLPGGRMGWAAGVQYRHTWIENWNTPISNRDVTPCPDTPITGAMDCTPFGESPFNFLSTYAPQDLDRGVYAGFVEFSLPVSDSLNMQVAARYEDYGNKGGSSFDPKLSLKWQIIDQLAFRAAASTTFRAPGQTQLVDDSAIGFSQIYGASRAVRLAGNPNLKPEESFQWSAGFIVNAGGFRATVDYWSFDFDKMLMAEPAARIAAVVFPTANDADNRCAEVDPAFLAERFVFAGDTCSISNLLQVNVQTINGAGQKNDGVDITMDYTFDVGPGTLVVGASGTWIHKFETETLVRNGVVLEPGFDGVGYYNLGTSLYPLPEWRAQGYLDFSAGRHNVRWTANFVDQYRDQRDGIQRGDLTLANIFTANSPNGKIIESRVLHNVTYRVELPSNMTLAATIENIFDEDPSFVRSELNYDPVTGQPLGRTIKLGFRKTF
jgi:iron complex outermembrane receptor protein